MTRRRIETAADFKAARDELSLSWLEMARALRLCPSTAADDDPAVIKASNRVREMEAGTRPLTGPVTALAEALLTGFRPCGFPVRRGLAWPALDRDTVHLANRYMKLLNNRALERDDQFNPKSRVDSGDAIHMALQVAIEEIEREFPAEADPELTGADTATCDG